MTAYFTGVFEGGVLRPTEPVELTEGSQVEVIVIQPSTVNSPRSAADLLAEIAALPMEPNGQVFSGRDHDRILYGEGRGAK